MKNIRYNVITFPGSNCDRDIQWISQLHGGVCEFVWHKDSGLKNPDVVVVPGGFSYGDYLRVGAIAKFSNVMKSVIEFANKGGLVIGICNGFQILTEAELLPGALLMNNTLKFICQHQFIKVENTDTPFSNEFHDGTIVDFPISHKNGNYYISEDALKRLQDNGQIVFRYCDADGKTNEIANPNGSVYNIAGIVNEKKNVLGMMPHPERSAEGILPTNCGSTVFNSINKWVYANL
jgi:phosphoribosylformylglycinamidine synthase